MKLQIFTTGGTFDKVYYDALSDFQIGDPMAPEILREAGVTFDWEVEGLTRKDSLELTDEDRELIRSRVAACPARHILITHGTDTMTKTADVLHDIPGKVIVFVGAMQPARMRTTDAPFNLGFAIGALQVLQDGIYIAMNGRIFEAGKVKKNRAEGRFEDS
ncbi:asparaginase domain-containing protein [Pseudomonas schmalbachii]|uniref:Asparaginase n=1 Tax=Pseudomonas schmalbachii TaxID=2816993 RepID=A0ABS3TUD0_9PSED|nr:asparaginase domain-containing protein [Pseudomonas schmalbachii]MBO3276285.1 asparaginase [Pseudomonas schmalbachii]